MDELEDFEKTKDYMLGYVKGEKDGKRQERDSTVMMLKEWRRHHDLMDGTKSLYYSKCIVEILEHIEGK